MNYNFMIVGSCLQTPEDVDKLRSIGVKTIFCLQQDIDLQYFGVDITSIREYANTYDDIQHLRAEIRDFDAFDLQMRLPAVVSKLHNAINRHRGVTYIHCTAGLGRAPAVALAYMFWIQGYKLSEAHRLLLSKRQCFPKLDAIKSATVDIRIPMNFDREQGLWILQRELLEGRYEYNYIVDGEWTGNNHELLIPANKDSHVNNCVQVLDASPVVNGASTSSVAHSSYLQAFDSDPNSITAALQKRLMGDDPDRTKNERFKIRQLLEACLEEE